MPTEDHEKLKCHQNERTPSVSKQKILACGIAHFTKSDAFITLTDHKGLSLITLHVD